MLSLLIATSEPSKVAFYFAGGVLAAWAVVLAGLGLTRPEFPYTVGGQRVVMGISFALMAIAVGAAIATSK